MRVVFGEVKKNNSDMLQVALEVYKRSPVIDVRVPAGERMTTKGLTCGVHVWKALLPVIASAIEEFEKQLANPSSEFAIEIGQ